MEVNIVLAPEGEGFDIFKKKTYPFQVSVDDSKSMEVSKAVGDILQL